MFRCTPRRWVSSNGRDGRSPASVTGRVSGCVEPRTPVREPGSAPAPRAAGLDADTSPPPPVSREAATSLNRAPQARREIGGAFGRPVVAGELAHHERVLRPYAAAVSCDRRQSLPYRSAPRPAREGDEAGFRVRLVFGSERHAAFRDSKKTRDTFPVGQKPRLHAPYRDPEAHSRRGVGKVPLLTGGRAFIPVEVAKRKPGRMPRGLVESAQACPECGNARREPRTSWRRRLGPAAARSSFRPAEDAGRGAAGPSSRLCDSRRSPADRQPGPRLRQAGAKIAGAGLSSPPGPFPPGS